MNMRKWEKVAQNDISNYWFNHRHFLGLNMPISLPQEYVKLLSVALMAVLDSVLGGMRSAKEGNYDNQIFISGFFVNAFVATLLCYFGGWGGLV